MSGSVNLAVIVGNLGQDPEVRSMQDGTRVCTLSVATSDTWTDKRSGERREKTEWHRVVIWNEHLVKIAEQYLTKGSKVYLEGKMQSRKWTDKDGIEKYSQEVVLGKFKGEMQILSSKREAPDENIERVEPRRRPSDPPDLDDEIPF